MSDVGEGSQGQPRVWGRKGSRAMMMVKVVVEGMAGGGGGGGKWRQGGALVFPLL